MTMFWTDRQTYLSRSLPPTLSPINVKCSSSQLRSLSHPREQHQPTSPPENQQVSVALIVESSEPIQSPITAHPQPTTDFRLPQNGRLLIPSTTCCPGLSSSSSPSLWIQNRFQFFNTERDFKEYTTNTWHSITVCNRARRLISRCYLTPLACIGIKRTLPWSRATRSLSQKHLTFDTILRQMK